MSHASEALDAIRDAEEDLQRVAKSLHAAGLDPADDESMRRLRRIREDLGELHDRIEENEL